ncbi:MAG: inositol monophosphatase family protein [Myxococcota bacterium]
MPPEPAPALFVEILSPALRQAAAIARALEGRVQNNPKPDETSETKQALTIADTATQEALLVPLLENFPQVRIEAEEDTPSVARFPQRSDSLVVIDPIDGTLHSYLAREGPYAVMVGLALADRFEAALVALPREGLFFSAVRGAGAQVARAAGPGRPAKLVAEGERVLVSNGMPESVFESLRGRGLQPIPACGGAVAVAPLIAGVRGGVRYAPGSGGVSIRGRIGALISRQAGALLRGHGGRDFPDDLHTAAPALLVAKTEEDMAILDEALASAGLP